MPQLLDPSSPNDLPDPHASYIVSRVIVEAWLQTVSRKQGKRFLENLASVLQSREDMAHVVVFRRRPTSKDIAKVEREALAALRQMIPAWLLRLPPK